MESLATLVALGLTIWWSYSETRTSERILEAVEGLEQQVAALEHRLERAEQRLAQQQQEEEHEGQQQMGAPAEVAGVPQAAQQTWVNVDPY